MRLVETLRMLSHLMRGRMICHHVAGRRRDDQVAVGRRVDAAHEARKLAVKQHPDPTLRTIEADRREADSIARVEHAVAAEGDPGGTAEAGLNQPAFATVRHN